MGGEDGRETGTEDGEKIEDEDSEDSEGELGTASSEDNVGMATR